MFSKKSLDHSDLYDIEHTAFEIYKHNVNLPPGVCIELAKAFKTTCEEHSSRFEVTSEPLVGNLPTPPNLTKDKDLDVYLRAIANGEGPF